MGVALEEGFNSLLYTYVLACVYLQGIHETYIFIYVRAKNELYDI